MTKLQSKKNFKIVIPISVEAIMYSHRVENIVVRVAIERSPVTGQNLADDGAAGLRTVTEMDIPLLVPHAVQGKAGEGRYRRREVGLTEGAKAVLRPGANVRVPRVHR